MAATAHDSMAAQGVLACHSGWFAIQAALPFTLGRSCAITRGPNSPGAPQSKRGPTEWVRSGRGLVWPDRFGPMFTKPGYLIGAARARE
jgi:hypothetical protein